MPQCTIDYIKILKTEAAHLTDVLTAVVPGPNSLWDFDDAGLWTHDSASVLRLLPPAMLACSACACAAGVVAAAAAAVAGAADPGVAPAGAAAGVAVAVAGAVEDL